MVGNLLVTVIGMGAVASQSLRLNEWTEDPALTLYVGVDVWFLTCP